MKKRAHIIVHGVVQGVFFRYNTLKEAQELGVTGWVRNLPDGGVEIVCEGEKNSVEMMVVWSQKGPGGALVKHTDLSWEEYAGEFTTFEIRH